jgi:hypothetical protein
VDAVLLLQRRADDQAAAARDDGRAAELGVLFENEDARARVARLDAGRDARAAGADDRDVGLVLLNTCHVAKAPCLPDAPIGAGG